MDVNVLNVLYINWKLNDISESRVPTRHISDTLQFSLGFCLFQLTPMPLKLMGVLFKYSTLRLLFFFFTYRLPEKN